MSSKKDFFLKMNLKMLEAYKNAIYIKLEKYENKVKT